MKKPSLIKLDLIGLGFSVVDFTVDSLKFCDALFDQLFQFLVFGSSFIIGNISQLVQQFLGDTQGITG